MTLLVIEVLNDQSCRAGTDRWDSDTVAVPTGGHRGRDGWDACPRLSHCWRCSSSRRFPRRRSGLQYSRCCRCSHGPCCKDRTSIRRSRCLLPVPFLIPSLQLLKRAATAIWCREQRQCKSAELGRRSPRSTFKKTGAWGWRREQFDLATGCARGSPPLDGGCCHRPCEWCLRWERHR